MTIERLEHLPLADGDILRLPAGTTEAALRQLADAITHLHPGKRILLLTCPIEKVSETDLAALGLYRSVPQPTRH